MNVSTSKRMKESWDDMRSLALMYEHMENTDGRYSRRIRWILVVYRIVRDSVPPLTITRKDIDNILWNIDLDLYDPKNKHELLLTTLYKLQMLYGDNIVPEKLKEDLRKNLI